MTRRALLVHAHPEATSFNHVLARTATTALERGGWHVDVADLYAAGFATAMTTDERRAYHEAVPIIDPLVQAHAALVKRADALVFVYPTWWWGMPAIMKGWLERVLVPGIGFAKGEDGKVRPAMGNVTRLVGITTYGSRRSEMFLLADSGRRVIRRTVYLNTCWHCRSTWLGLYGMDRASNDDRMGFIDRVDKKLSSL
jgi:NAD(P)H dehydrogenase (quinone)